MFVLGIASSAVAGPFADVPAKHWSYDAINQLDKAGIINGYGDGTFKGDKTITRYEMAIIVAKAMEHADKADAANKALIEKLSKEYAKELATLGIKVSTLEDKVNSLEKLKVSGDFYLRGFSYDDKIDNANTSGSFWRTRVRINLQDQVSDDMTFFTRFGVRNTFGTDANLSGYGPFMYDSNGSYQAMDQYGIKYASGNWKYSLGRQSVALGQGLILGTGDDVEWDNKFNGLIASTKVGTVGVNVIGGMTNANAVVGGVANQWYGADLKSKVGDNVSLGFAYAHSKPDNSASVNYEAVNTTITPSANLAINAEYAKSNAADNNKAYTIGGTYSFGKDSLTAQYLNIDNNAVDAWNAGYCRLSLTVLGVNAGLGNSMRGWDYYYSHPMNKISSVNIYYLSVTTPGYSGHDNEGFVELQTRF
jgi:hypothetical protein